MLVETDAFASTLCTTCEIVHLYNGIYCFGFTLPALRSWGKQVLEIVFKDHYVEENQVKYLIIHSTLHHYEFHFFEDEFYEFQDLLGQTLSLLEIYEIAGISL